MKIKISVLALITSLVITGCISNAPPTITSNNAMTQSSLLVNVPNRQSAASNLTLGRFQQAVKRGVSSEEIISQLGAPNVITSNRSGGQTWVYDKISQETEQAWNTNESVRIQSTRTLTVVIRFDALQRVQSFDFHTSQF